MKAKFLATAVLLSTSNFVAANGGLGINDAEQHMNAVGWANTQADQQELVVQGPLDQFQAYISDQVTVVDANQFKQNYDGQS